MLHYNGYVYFFFLLLLLLLSEQCQTNMLGGEKVELRTMIRIFITYLEAGIVQMGKFKGKMEVSTIEPSVSCLIQCAGKEWPRI